MQLVKKTALALLMISGLALSATLGLASPDDKAPLTTNSDAALENYLKGRVLIENLRAADARPFLQKAVQLDPDFAIAHLQLAGVQPTQTLLFESFKKAISLVDKVSEAEKNWILGLEAGAIDGDPVKQMKLYSAIVKAYPNDERAHNLVATLHFIQQDWDKAIAGFTKTIEINPNYAGGYNLLGYAYRSVEEYDKAEEIFKKYTELIPNDPNPYDSYAELLMKVGRFEESIKQYKKALEINPEFVFSYAGIASNYCFVGKHDQARDYLAKMYLISKTKPQKRTALLGMANSYNDEARFEEALAELDKLYALDAAAGDTSSMAGSLIIRGFTAIEAPGGGMEALENFESAVKLVQASSLSEKTKNQFRIGHFFNAGRAYEVIGDLDNATKSAQACLKEALAKNNTNQLKGAHHLIGRIALHKGAYDLAIKEMLQSNLQNPNHLYYLGEAYEGKSDLENAKLFYSKVANFNGLNSSVLASVRVKAVEKVKRLSL